MSNVSSLKGVSHNLCGPKANLGSGDFPLSPEIERNSLVPCPGCSMTAEPSKLFQPHPSTFRKTLKGSGTQTQYQKSPM